MKEKPCDECENKFTLKEDLVRQQRIHTIEKSYQCDGCDKCQAPENPQ